MPVLRGGETGITSIEVNGSALFTVLSGWVAQEDNTVMGGSMGMNTFNTSAEFNVCPVPGEPGQYYIIYNHGGCSSLYYSIVDMSLGGGTGSVIELNTPFPGSGNYGEGLEIVKQPGTLNYWLVTYECLTGIKVFEISDSGIGVSSTLPFDNGIQDVRGELDYHQGKLVLVSPSNLGGSNEFSDINVAVFDFNDNLGSASLLTTLDIEGAFGAEFSPDGSKLYVTSKDVNNNNLHQYDFNTNTLTSYSIFDFSLGVYHGIGQMEMGADGNLYSPGKSSNYILKIESPNDINFTYSFLETDYQLKYGVSEILDLTMVLNIQGADAICSYSDDGQATISISGGVEPYTINWGHTNEQIGITATDLAPGIYTAYVTDGIGSQDSISITISSPPPFGVVDFDVENANICLGDSVYFLNYSHSDSPLVEWEWGWDFGDNLNSELQFPVHLYSSTGTYDVSLSITDTTGCAVDTTLIDLITVNPIPEAHFTSSIPPDNSNCDLEVQFFNTSLNYTNLNWDFGDDQTSAQTSPIHLYDVAGDYTVQLRVINEFLCEDTTYLDVTAQIIPTLFTPNTFTPNGDKLNDVFSVSGNCFDEFEMWIYNRWGSNVFYTNDYTVGWNGAVNGVHCSIGSYVWKATYVGEQGPVTKHGIVNLIR